MNNTKIQINIDTETKTNAEQIFKELGIDINIAVNIFLKKAIQYKGIPFDVCIETPNETTIAALKEGEMLLNDPNCPVYNDVEELKAALGV